MSFKTIQNPKEQRRHFLLQQYKDYPLDFTRPKSQSSTAKESSYSTSGISIYLPPDLDELDIWGSASDPLSDRLGFLPFKSWLDKTLSNFALQNEPSHVFHQDPYSIREIAIQAVDWFKPKDKDGNNGRIGFMKIQSKLETDSGEWLPGAVFLRGGSVAVLFIIRPFPETADTKDYAVLTVQARPAAGSLAFTEIPAGMLDDAGSNFSGKAANEIREELGISIKAEDLVDMSALALEHVPNHPWTKLDTAPRSEKGHILTENLMNAVYPSVGACDEFIPLMLCQKRLTREKLDELKGRATGLREEGEKITLKVVELQSLWREAARDAKALSALALYEGLMRTGQCPPMPNKPDASE